jgi:hypothetical protein
VRLPLVGSSLIVVDRLKQRGHGIKVESKGVH